MLRCKKVGKASSSLPTHCPGSIGWASDQQVTNAKQMRTILQFHSYPNSKEKVLSCFTLIWLTCVGQKLIHKFSLHSFKRKKPEHTISPLRTQQTSLLHNFLEQVRSYSLTVKEWPTIVKKHFTSLLTIRAFYF